MTKIYEVFHKVYGKVEVLLDDDDYDKFIKEKPLRVKFDKTINNFYVYQNLVAVHRIITKCPQGMCVDHINRNTLDNRKCNLRVCTQQENNNNRKVRCTCKTGYPGIHIEKETGKYITRIIFDGVRYYIGKYNTLEEAIKKQTERRKQLALQL